MFLNLADKNRRFRWFGDVMVLMFVSGEAFVVFLWSSRRVVGGVGGFCILLGIRIVLSIRCR